MKKIIPLLLATLLMLGTLTACSAYTSNEPCWWCNRGPTMSMTNPDNEKVYICKDCASTCMYCDNHATKFGFNLLGGPIPVCNDCYNSEM